jgi:O-antigen ligase
LGFGFVQSENPHNQYILFLVETGLIGLGAFLYLNYICWNFSRHLSQFWMHATRIVLLSYGVANLFNSFLFDFAESLFFSAFMALAFSELLREKKEEIVQT